MPWSVVTFGKHKGKTLPQIIMRDPGWFFWILPRLYGKLAKQAEKLDRKARAIKLPKGKGKDMEVEYWSDIDNRFCGFEFTEASSWQSQYALRQPYLDLRLPLLTKKNNKRAGRILIRGFRRHYFGTNKRLTKERREKFFNNDKSFLC
jgi:hypothetical protein